MPRFRRLNFKDGIYHVYSRSISELILFKEDSDKIKFLKLINKYKLKYDFKVYAYCIMGTHYHLMVFCNNADINQFMKSINQCYAQYYNLKYERHGHVFQDRFNSILLNKGSDIDILRLSAYIHNNPKNLKNLNGNVKNYPFSSLNAYLDTSDDEYDILDPHFILGKLSQDLQEAKVLYGQFFKNYVETCQSIPIYSDEILKLNTELPHENSPTADYQNYSVQDITLFVSNLTGMPNVINVKYHHGNTLFKALCIVIMQSVCNLSLSRISSVLGNTSLSNVSKLSSIGYAYIAQNKKYNNFINDFISYSSKNKNLRSDSPIIISK